MQVTASHHYDKSLDEVFSFFTDANKATDRLANLGSDVKILDTQEDDERFTLKSQRQVDVNVPSSLKRFLSPTLTATQTERWEKHSDGSRKGHIYVELSGVPVKIEGTITLRTQDSGTSGNVDLEVSSGVPLVGKQLANFVAEDVKKTVETEYQYIKTQQA